jgi:hypothetical protein
VDDHHLTTSQNLYQKKEKKKKPALDWGSIFLGDKLSPLGDKLKGPATHTKDISGKNGPKSPYLDYKS